jgi:hypothetical protein
MTLSTDVYIQGEVDLDTLRRIVQEALAKFDDRPVEAQIWQENGGPDNDSEYWQNTFESVPGQGLPAWTIVYHGADGAWLAPEDKYDDDVEEGEEPRFVAPRHFARIDFDTAYGYQGPNRMTCNHLHVLLMSEVGDWLKAQHVPWQWHNEYSGDIYDGFEGFASLIGDGVDAQSWFQDIAKPAIEADILRSETIEEGPR